MSDNGADASHQNGRPTEYPVFPYAVIRHFPAVYEQRSVQFITDPSASEAKKDVILLHLHGSEEDGPEKDHRSLLVASLLTLSRTTDKRACAVFGPKDAIYIEPSGETRASADLPRSEWHWGTA